MDRAAPILVLVQDLFFRAKIDATARAGGWPVTCLGDLPKEGALPAARGCLIDLESAGPVALAALRKIAAAMPTIAFASHGKTELLARALAAGCKAAVARSRLAAELPRLLAELAGTPMPDERT
ncbi:MAG: hypothetical protein JNL90_10000 [Planctomycetes bacterium]|nr:hypothetical protein [Planctomycetota bacterium]